jgi:hypothetical protein
MFINNFRKRSVRFFLKKISQIAFCMKKRCTFAAIFFDYGKQMKQMYDYTGLKTIGLQNRRRRYALYAATNTSRRGRVSHFASLMRNNGGSSHNPISQISPSHVSNLTISNLTISNLTISNLTISCLKSYTLKSHSFMSQIPHYRTLPPQ